MNVAKKLNRLSLCFGIVFALHAAKAETTNVFGGWAILPAETLALSPRFPGELEPLWNLPTNKMTEAIQRLPDYLQMVRTNGSSRYTNKLPGIQKRLSATGCQFVGVTINGRKGILLNCFPLSDRFSDGWKERFVKVYDGGPQWWSVAYLLDEKKFTRLRVDLGF